jgi:nicotinamidase-related amidase
VIQLIHGRAALVVVDMQHDFLDETAGCYAPGSAEIVARTARLIDAAREAGVPVIFTQEAHRPGGVDAGREADPGAGAGYPGGGPDSPVPPHCIEGTPGIDIVDELAPRGDDLLIKKRRYSCFLGTDLDLLLRNLGIETLLVTGVDSNVCVLWTVGEAFQRDYHVRVVEDCVAGSNPEEHEAALLIMRTLVSGGVPVTSDDVIAALERRPANVR